MRLLNEILSTHLQPNHKKIANYQLNKKKSKKLTYLF
jgi:hypothetical protein